MSESMTMVERVARLCCIGDPDQLVYITPDGEGVRTPQSGVDRPGKLWELQTGRAQSIIMAMREENCAMLDAGTLVLWPHVQHLLPGSTAVSVWHSMIDAALADTPSTLEE